MQSEFHNYEMFDVLHGLKIFPIESATEHTEHWLLVPATTHRCTKNPKLSVYFAIKVQGDLIRL
jgi:hypothetical protein